MTSLAQRILEENDKKVKITKNLLRLCDLVIEASLYWSSKDEIKNPKQRTLRTMAGIFKEEYII